LIKDVESKDKDGNKIVLQSKSYLTEDIRCKGRGKIGKIRKLQFDQGAMDAIKKWLEVRGEDDCPYMLCTKYAGKVNQVGESTLNNWCSKDFAEIIGRRMNPHAIRSSRATTSVVEDGKSIESVKNLLGHENTETTRIYVIRDEEEDTDELFMDD
jgi:site-specific recombinase XerC